MAMLNCQVSSMTSADYECSNQGPPTGTAHIPAPKVDSGKTTPCASAICAYTCPEIDNAGGFGDGTVYGTCGC
jgi:hypothetical protein